MDRIKKNLIGLVLIIMIWQVSSLALNQALILPGPARVFRAFLNLNKSKVLFTSSLVTSYRVFIGLGLSLLIGIFLAFISYSYRLEDYLSPLISLLRGAPVVSFILIVLFFAKNTILVIIVIQALNIPLVYDNSLNRLKTIDRGIIDLANVFKMGKIKKFAYIYLPRLRESFFTSLFMLLGLSYKAAVSAELIGGAHSGLGALIYFSKQAFDMESIIAITLTIIVISLILEGLGKKLLQVYEARS